MNKKTLTAVSLVALTLSANAAVLTTTFDASTFDAATQTGSITFSPTCVITYAVTTTAADPISSYTDTTIGFTDSFASGTTAVVGFGGLAAVELQVGEELTFTFSQAITINSFGTNAYHATLPDTFGYSLDGGTATNVLANTFGVQTTTVGASATSFTFASVASADSASPNGVFEGMSVSFDDAGHTVPEPSSALLIGLGALGAFARRKRA